MTINTNNAKFKFWRKWTLLNALVIIILYPVGLFISLMISEAFGYSTDAWAPPFVQVIMFIGNGVLIGFGIGITQWLLLRKNFNVSSFWKYSVAIGFVIAELIVGLILLKLDINRGELNFVEGNPLAHSLIMAMSGLLIGLIQIPFLKIHSYGKAYWVLASTLAWGLSVLVTSIDHGNEISLLINFVIGAIIYGSITGATLLWILKPRGIES